MANYNSFILGINGSPYRDGITASLLNKVLQGASDAGAETKVIHLYDLKVEPVSGCYSADPAKEKPDSVPTGDILKLYPEILRAHGLVLATPVYWANMSGAMKNFIDHLTPLENDGFKLQGKLAAFIAASKENEGGLELAALSMVAALAQMGVLIPPNAIMWHPGGWHTAAEAHKSWAEEDAPLVGRNMVRIIELLREHPISWAE